MLISSASDQDRTAHVTMVGCLSLLLLSATLCLHGFPGLLPYYLDPDEPHFFIAASEIRLTGSVKINPLYPPLRPYEMVVGQIIVDVLSNTQASAKVNGTLGRAGSAFYAILLLAFVFRIGRELHSPLAGLLAVGLMAFDLQLVGFAHVARGDTLSWVLTAGVIAGTLHILKRASRRAWAITLLCSLGAFLAKYSAAPIWLLPAYLLLVKSFPNGAIRWFFVIAILAIVVGFIVFARANAEAWSYAFIRTGFGFLLSPSFNPLSNFRTSLGAFVGGMGLGWLSVGASLSLSLIVVWRRFALSHRTLLALLLATVLGTATVFTLTTARYHDAYTVVIIWAIFGGLSLSILAERGKTIGLLIAVGVVVSLAWPRAVAAWEFGETYTSPHPLASLGDWIIEHVPQGGRVVVERSTPFNSYAGFPGRPIYHQFTVDNLFAEDLAAYRERGYEYIVWSSKGYHDPQFSDPQTLAGHAYFAEAIEVARWLPPEYRNPGIVVFQLSPIQQHPLYAWFTPAISFRGYDLNRDTFKPGDTVDLMLYWMSAEQIQANYIVFVHLLDPQTGQLIAGQDGPPDYGNTPTYEWVGDMQFVRDQRIFTIPANAPAGDYSLRIGMYDADTKARVEVLDLQYQPIGDGLELQDIKIEK